MDNQGSQFPPYHLGLFIAPGKPAKTKPIDIVATKWIKQHPSNKKAVVVKYPPPPYNEDSSMKYNQYLMDLADPPTHWKEFTFKIRGKADNLKEAFKKLENLRSQEHVLTVDTDQDLDADELGKAAADKIKQQNLISQSKKILKASQAKRKIISTPLSSTEKSSQRQPSLTKPSCSTGKSLQEKSGFPVERLVQSFEPNTSASSNNVLGKAKSFRKSSEGSLNHTILEYLVKVSQDVNEIKKNTETIMQDQILIMSSTSKNPKQFIGTVQQLAEKFNLNIPFPTLEEFKEFDNMLKENQALVDDVKMILQTGLDPLNSISKSIATMFKFFLSKEVALQFNAVKTNSSKSEVIIGTKFFSCVEVIIRENRSICNIVTSGKEINSALGIVLGNVRKWPSNSQITCSTTKGTIDADELNDPKDTNQGNEEYCSPPTKKLKLNPERMTFEYVKVDDDDDYDGDHDDNDDGYNDGDDEHDDDADDEFGKDYNAFLFGLEFNQE